MASNGPSITFVASRVRMASGLVYGAVVVAVVAWLGTRLAVTGMSIRTLPVLVPVLGLFGALLALFVYGDVKAIGALRHPSRLTIDHHGIAEERSGETRSGTWQSLGPPEARSVPMARTTLYYVAFPQAPGGDVKFRSDLYPQSAADILTAVEDARSGRQLRLPAASGATADYLGLALSIVVGVGALAYVWFRT